MRQISVVFQAGEFFRAAHSSAIAQQRESDSAPEESLETPLLTDQVQIMISIFCFVAFCSFCTLDDIF